MEVEFVSCPKYVHISSEYEIGTEKWRLDPARHFTGIIIIRYYLSHKIGS